MKDLSVKDICQKIWGLEQEFGLLDLEMRGVKVWQFLRMNIYYEIAQKTGVFSRHVSPRQRPTDISFRLRRLFNSLFIGNPLLDFKQRDVLVFPHPRSVEIDQEQTDIYTKYLINEFKELDIHYQAYERNYENRLRTQEGRPRKHFEVIEILYPFYRKFNGIKFNKEETEQIDAINERIKQVFNVQIDLLEKFRSELGLFKFKHLIFKKVLRNKGAKRVYLVVNYGWLAPLIKAAKDLNIETVELQHGTFSEYHLGYSFPGQKGTVDYFPDQFWVWNEFWKGMCPLPIKDEDVVVYSFKYFEDERQKFAAVKKREDQIVVISQGAIGYKLAQEVLKNIDQLKSYQIKYKLHPGEYGIWRENPALVSLSQRPNVQILADNTTPLYQLLAESKYLIGVFSTAVFEGLDFGCELILVDLPGIEYMTNLIKQGKAKFVKEGGRIADCLPVGAA